MGVCVDTAWLVYNHNSNQGAPMNKKTTLGLAGILIVLAVVSFLFLNGAKPDTVCVEEGAPYSGFVDEEKDNCPISDESYQKIVDYDSKPKIGRIAGLVLGVAGVGVGVVGLRKKA